MKRLLGIFITCVILGMALMAGLTAFWLIDDEIEAQLEQQVQQVHQQVRQRFQVFDELIAGDERDLQAQARTALQAIGRLIEADPRPLQDWSVTELEQLARQHGADAIYLIDSTTTVRATNFLPDQDFELGTISDSFRAYLLSLYGSGRLEVDRINVSSKTGIIQIYAYYAPPGADYLVEISYDVKKFLSRHRSSRYVDFIFGDFFSAMAQGSMLLERIDLYLVNNYAAFPFLNNTLPITQDALPEIPSEGMIQLKAGDKLYYYSRADLRRSRLHSANYLAIRSTFTLAPVQVLLNKLFGLGLLLMLLILGGAYLLLSLGFDRWIMRRIERIIQALEHGADGDYRDRIPVGKHDELGLLAEQVNRMQQRIAQRERQLDQARQTLEHRVAERTQELSDEILAREQVEAQLRQLAATDHLTGTLNRRSFEEVAKQELERARRHQRDLSLLVLDVDYFKQVNDRFGHQVGDEVLSNLAALVRNSLRPSDHLCRHGGEEFIILLPETGIGQAQQLAERLRRRIAATPLCLGRNHKITVSIGVSAWHSEEYDLLAAIQRADQALYRAKDNGRNQIALLPALVSEQSSNGSVH